ncbi:hypothetical protein I0P70_04005 [Pontibacter sp. FD36]|uniref:hypothetical protein n=1 Tax=Pontibacter sp. FD36 TaxID=2789860 RepID=UPI0018A8B38E|nr:hypothetical protein [Pontibacter sp. FD36]MBF8962401.1 hypothetical protein [Pontibacter sp. FD36]
MMTLTELMISFVLLHLFIFVAGKLSVLVQNRLARRVDIPLLVNFVSNIVRRLHSG